MTFLAPFMLIGTAVAAIPLIIHIMNRRRFKVVRWAAMDFLKDIMKKNTRILQLKDLILLLMRTLALLLLALAMGRMACVHTGGWGSKGDIGDALFVFDTSYSMSYVIGSETLLDRAKKAAQEVLQSYGRGSRVQIITVDGKSVTRLFTGATEELDVAAKALSDLSVGSGSTSMSYLLDVAAVELGSLWHSSKNVYVFTDLQLASWDVRADDPAGVQTQDALDRADGVYFVDCSGPNRQNLAIAALELPDNVAVVDTPCQFTVRLVNTGTAPRSDVHLGMRVYGLKGKPGTADAASGLTGEQVGDLQSVPLVPLGHHGMSVPLDPYLFATPGWHLVEVFLEGGDNLAVDNSRFLAVDVRDSVRVLCVEGSNVARETRDRVGDTYPLRWLLAAHADTSQKKRPPYRSVRATVEWVNAQDWLVPPGTAADGGEVLNDLARYSLVVLANARDLQVEFVAALERFVSRGGGLIIFLGENVSDDDVTYSKLLYRDGLGLCPVRLLKPVGLRLSEYKDRRDLFHIDTGPGELTDFVFRTGNDRLAKQSTFSRPVFSKAWTMVLPQHDAELKQRLAKTTPGTTPGSGELAGLAGGTQTYRSGEPYTVARFTHHGAPFAVRRSFGRGRVVLFNTTCDWTWTTLPLSAAVSMYMYTMRDLIGVQLGKTSHRVGEPLTHHVPRKLAKSLFVLTGPRGETEERMPAPRGKDALGRPTWRVELEGGRTRLPGPYCIGMPDTPDTAARRFFAVNVDPRESDLKTVPDAEVKEFFPLIEDKVTVGRYPEGVTEVLERSKPVRELSLGLLIAALLLFTAETIVAACFAPEPLAPQRPQWARVRTRNQEQG